MLAYLKPNKHNTGPRLRNSMVSGNFPCVSSVGKWEFALTIEFPSTGNSFGGAVQVFDDQLHFVPALALAAIMLVDITVHFREEK